MNKEEHYIIISPEQLNNACKESRPLWPEDLKNGDTITIHYTVDTALDLARKDGKECKVGALGWLEINNVVPKILKDADLRGYNLSGADFRCANLYGANFEGANFYDANLIDTNFCGANLEGADLKGADLKGANLYGANLYGANLYGANLYGANLIYTNLYGAELEGVNFCGTDLRWTYIDDKNYTVVGNGFRRGNLTRKQAVEMAKKMQEKMGRCGEIKIYYRDGSQFKE